MTSSPLSPSSRLDALSTSLSSAATVSPLRAADILDSIRRLLPDLPSTHDTSPIARAVLAVIRNDPSNLLLAHRSVAVLAHPALASAAVPVQPVIVAAMDRLANSAAFQHTAMAALQNAANTCPAYRDTVILAAVSAMRHHHHHSGVLLRGADLLAFHLNQPSPAPLSSSFRVASRIVVDTSSHLSSSAQGASTALLALVAAARHASSLASFSGRPSSTTRFSRGGPNASSVIVDHKFAAAVVAAMSRHPANASVQVLACEVIRVAAAGATNVARSAAKELHSAGAASAILATLQGHPTDVTVVDRALVALRSLLLGGGSHGRSIKPSLHVDGDLADYVARVADVASDSIAVKDRDLSSAAAVLAMDFRKAGNPGSSLRGNRDRNFGETSRFAGFGRRIMRRIRFGQKQNWYDMEYDRYAEEQFTEKGADPQIKLGKEFSTTKNRMMNGRGSFSVMRVNSVYGRAAGSSSRDMAKEAPSPPRTEMGKTNRKMSDGAALGDNNDGGPQIPLSKKWRSVSGRWNQRGRRGSTVSTGMDGQRMTPGVGPAATAGAAASRRERRGPLTLSGSEMANLTRQPSRIFGMPVEGHPLRMNPGDPRTTEGRAVFISAGQEDFGF